MRKYQTCPMCKLYDVCKFWETLRDIPISDAVDFKDEAGFRKWQVRFARWCMYFRLDEVQLEDLIAVGLDFIYLSSDEG